jgi:hypothetical protein
MPAVGQGFVEVRTAENALGLSATAALLVTFTSGQASAMEVFSDQDRGGTDPMIFQFDFDRRFLDDFGVKLNDISVALTEKDDGYLYAKGPSTFVGYVCELEDYEGVIKRYWVGYLVGKGESAPRLVKLELPLVKDTGGKELREDEAVRVVLTHKDYSKQRRAAGIKKSYLSSDIRLLPKADAVIVDRLCGDGHMLLLNALDVNMIPKDWNHLDSYTCHTWMIDARPRSGIIEIDKPSAPVAIAKRILTAGRVVRVCAHGGNEVGFGDIRVGARHFAQAAEQIRNAKGTICSHLILEGCQMGGAFAQEIADNTGATVWGAEVMMVWDYKPLVSLKYNVFADLTTPFGQERDAVEKAFGDLIVEYWHGKGKSSLELLQLKWVALEMSMFTSCHHKFRKAGLDVCQRFDPRIPDRGKLLLPHAPRK